jgi:beta-aspartyl-peptidase (threonine type)
MKSFIKHMLFVLLIVFYFSCGNESQNLMPTSEKHSYAIVIHGGAGTITRANMTEEMELAYRAALQEALNEGEKVLKSGGEALEAVRMAIRFMEDHPLFNAGKGAVFNADGVNELDASVMTGQDRNAGAVSGLKRVKNPIEAAIGVMQQSEHVFLSGQGAEQFASQIGLEFVDPSYFFTASRWKSLQRVKESEKNTDASTRHGTVGAVALDQYGNIAAGTSTGGMTNKKYNRIGDAPVIGAGTYADNTTCGISCTGHGEYFIRLAVAFNIHAQMLYGNQSLEDAAKDVILQQLSALGGDGGVIGVDKLGNIVTVFNSEGMYRAWAKPGSSYIGIYKDE